MIAFIEIHESIVGAIIVLAGCVGRLFQLSQACTAKHASALADINRLKLALRTCPLGKDCGYWHADLNAEEIIPLPLATQQHAN